MFKTVKQVHGSSLITVWFAEGEIEDKGIQVYRESKVPIGESEPFYTLLTDLTEDEDAIKAHFAKNCRYEVNRAAREDISYRIMDGSDISDEDIDGFIEFFKAFWASKDSSLENPGALREELRAYRDADLLSFGQALLGGEVSVYHTYVHDESICRLMHSASLFRESNGEGNKKTLLGIANRALHFEEMKYFKGKGLTTYDWGGAGKEEEVASITHFKESFGGSPATFYDCRLVKGGRAKILNTASDIKNRIKG